MIIKRKNNKQSISPISILAIGGGVLALTYFLVKQSKNKEEQGHENDKTKPLSYDSNEDVNIVKFGNINLLEYLPSTQTDISVEVKNQYLLSNQNNQLDELIYTHTIPKLGLASDVKNNKSSVASLKGLIVEQPSILSKNGNLVLINKCRSQKLLGELKNPTSRRQMALMLDKVIEMSNSYLASSSNTENKEHLDALDRQRLASAILWIFIILSS